MVLEAYQGAVVEENGRDLCPKVVNIKEKRHPAVKILLARCRL